VRRRPLIQILPKASLADTGPLAALIAEFADGAMLAEIAREHRRGRRLLVQSANLDAQRPVIWDLGTIAASGAPNAVDVFREALLASASIQVTFPPVLFEVAGAVFDEMHADGSVISQATTLMQWQAEIHERTAARQDAPSSLKIYVVRNGKIAPEPEAVEYDIRAIASRSLSTHIKSQGRSDLLAAYEAAEVRRGDYYATWIGQDFGHEYPGPFDQDYMRALYRYGYALMRSGDAWSREPPWELAPSDLRTAAAGAAERGPPMIRMIEIRQGRER